MIDGNGRQRMEGLCRYFGVTVRSRKRCMIALILILLFSFVLQMFLQIGSIDTPVSATEFNHWISFGNEMDEKFVVWGWMSYSNRINEIKKVLASIRQDSLNAAMQLEKQNFEFETLSKQVTDKMTELRVLQMDIEEAKLYKKELQNMNRAPLFLPIPSKVEPSFVRHVRTEATQTIESVFDFSKCSIANGFNFYLYDIRSNASKYSLMYHRQLGNLPVATKEKKTACIMMSIVENEKDIASLAHWNIGINHVLLNVGDEPLPYYSNAIVVSSEFQLSTFKKNFDLTLHLKVPDYDKNEWINLSSLLPLSRNFLLSCVTSSLRLAPVLQQQLDSLARSAISTNDNFVFDFNCTMNSCTEIRGRLFKQSTFVLLFTDTSKDSSADFHEQLIAAFKLGAIPVVASLNAPLPVPDLIDWKRAVYTMPWQRLPELHFILRSFSPADIIEMRRQGRFLLQSYLLDKRAVIKTLISALKHRISLPGEQFETVQITPLFANQSIAPNLVLVKPPQFEEEYLGPMEAPHDSISYAHNFTALQMYSNHMWNDAPYGVGKSLEFIPFEPSFPSGFEMKEGLEWGFRPIESGSGVAFSAAIGGNRPREQFTVVMPTHDRIDVLTAAIERLNNLPYLNKVIIVWNGEDIPAADHPWPRIHVPVLFHKASSNSLNNRFLPFAQINTEAVLSIDDDIDLKQHEIVFAFRVWREQRMKIVGFPARHHVEHDGTLSYRSNYTCQHSIILTGAAFIHKAYLYAYTYEMPEVIREKVDEITNCEDLAMNFLVAHITREPPIKTTSKWTLSCPQCKTSLFRRADHYSQRHECIQFFAKIYGYNPLLFTQFRVDSVLFKTRLSAGDQKCFKYV